jgi:hypothetical protein
MRYVAHWIYHNGESDIPQRYAPMIAATRRVVEAAGHSYEISIAPSIYADPSMRAAERDRCAMMFAALYPDVVSIDLDCEIRFILATPPGKPYFAFTPGIGPHGFYYYVNGCCNYFERKLKELEKRRMRSGWTNGLFLPGEVGIIPRDSYSHEQFMTGKK